MQSFIDFITSPAPEPKPTTKKEVLKMLDAIWHHQDIPTRAYTALRRMIEALPTKEPNDAKTPV